MAFDLREYTIRRKVLKIFGASFHVYDASGQVVAFSSQKAFKLREDIRVFTDDTRSTELMNVRARQIVDFSAAYDMVDSTENTKIGAARRKGWSSMIRDSWEVLDANDQPIASLQEDSTAMALLRRFLVNLIPQTFHMRDPDGRELAVMRVHFNPFIYRMTVSVSDTSVDPRVVFGAAVLLAAIEGRQQ
ncbi:MAG: hypothetical protein CMJ90_06930 [Planctomycetes bacterium]|nr:hypothetical protein [Planctomycetota bacterium]